MSSATARTWATIVAGDTASTAVDADRVLRGDRRDRGHPVHSAARERLQVGLDAGPAAGVGAGDREYGAGFASDSDHVRRPRMPEVSDGPRGRTRTSSRDHGVPPIPRARHVAEQLELGQRGETPPGRDRGRRRPRRRSPPLSRPLRASTSSGSASARPARPARPPARASRRGRPARRGRGSAAGQQVVRPRRGAGADRAGHRPEVPAQVRGEIGGDQRAGALRRLDHHGHPGKRRHDPVARREGPAPRVVPGGSSEISRARGDPTHSEAARGRVGGRPAHSENGDGAPAPRARPGGRRRRSRRRGR